MTKTFTYLIDTKGYARKPSNYYNLTYRLNTVQPTTSDIHDFMSKVTQGYAFCVGVFNGNRSIENFSFTDILCLDFDSGNYTEAELLSGLSAKPNAIYQTFSSTEFCKKWRVIYLSKNPITSPYQYKQNLKFLAGDLNLDIASTDVARIFQGTSSDKPWSILSESSVFSPIIYPEKYYEPKPKIEIRNLNPYALAVAKDKAVKQARRVFYDTSRPRRDRLFKATVILVKSKVISESEISKIIDNLVEDYKEEFIDNYDKDYVKIVQSAIKWCGKR